MLPCFLLCMWGPFCRYFYLVAGPLQGGNLTRYQQSSTLAASCSASVPLNHVASVPGRGATGAITYILRSIINKNRACSFPQKPGPLARTRMLIFCLRTRSWPPQTPFHSTLAPQFPVPLEPCTRGWSVYHRLSHWRLRVMHKVLEISPGRDHLLVTCKAAASYSSSGGGQPNRILLRTVSRAELSLRDVLDSLRGFIHASPAFA
ncbi:hypothetical protein V8C35DRAFT_142221 [Trichoderma chlorosporum]